MQKILLTLVLSLIFLSCSKHEEILQKQINTQLQLGIEKESKQPGEAVSLYLEALTQSEKIDATESLRQCHTNLAIVYRSCELYPEAELHYLSALDFSHKISSSQEAKTLRNLGQLYKTWGNYKKAEQYYTQALELFQKEGDQKFVSMLNNDMGILAECKHEYEKALTYYSKTGDEGRMGNIGRMQVKLGHPEAALISIEKSISAFQKSSDMQNLSAVLIARVEALAALKRTGEAKSALVEAENVSGKFTGLQRKNLLEVYNLAQDLHPQSTLYKQKSEKIKSELELLLESGRAARFRDQSLIRKAEADRNALLYRAEKTHKRLIFLFACTTAVALMALALQYWRIHFKHKENARIVASIGHKRIKKNNDDLFDI